MNKAVFLDRDGTINIDKKFVHKIEDFEFEPGAIEALKKLSQSNYKLILITSQSGIGRGYFEESDYEKFTQHMLSELEKHGVTFDGKYHCPHHPTEGVGEYKTECECRKPKPGMILKACKEHNIDPKESFMIGDKWVDVKMGQNAGCRPILVMTGKAGSDTEFKTGNAIIRKNLLDAVEYILQ